MRSQERIGSSIGSFLLQQVLHEISEGTLFLAQDTHSNENVWLFLWNSDDASAALTEDIVDKITQRAQILQSIEMEANLRLRSWQIDDTTLFFVFDAFSSSQTLESIKPRLSREQALTLFSFLARYLEQYETLGLRVLQVTPTHLRRSHHTQSPMDAA